MERMIDGIRRYGYVERHLKGLPHGELLLNIWHLIGDDFYDNCSKVVSLEHVEPKQVLPNLEYLFHCRIFVKDNQSEIMKYDLDNKLNLNYGDFISLANDVISIVVNKEIRLATELANLHELPYTDYYNN